MAKFDLSNIKYDDEKVWELISSGFCCGVFQCESKLVQHWLKQIKPKNLSELSDIIALVRPGPLQSGMADDYLAYKNGNRKAESFGHEVIDGILSSSNHCMIYQESLLSIGNNLAWRHLEENKRLATSDKLRKAVGKKNQKAILDIGKEFVEGCIHNGVRKEIADKLFEIIKNNGRYSFNRSHSIAYAKIAYKTAYLKYYFPYQFLSTYLTYAKFKKKKKWEEIHNLGLEAKVFGIEIKSPNINKQNENFAIEDNSVRYGLCHMKYFGEKTIEFIKTLPRIDKWQQVIKLCNSEFYGEKLRSQTAEALISTGGFSDCGLSRTSLLNITRCLDRLSPKERNYIIDNIDSLNTIKELPELIKKCALEVSVSKREQMVISEAQMLRIDEYDAPSWIEQTENFYLGIALTATAVDSKDTTHCDKIVECVGDVPLYTIRKVAVIIDSIKETITKKGENPGQKMAIITVHDSTGQLDKLPIFPGLYDGVFSLIIQGNTVILTIKKNKGGWIVENLEQL